MKDLPPWGKTAVSYVKVASIVFAALFAILAGALDLYAKYDELRKKTESGYETLAPAVQELQKLFAEHIQDTERWADDVDDDIARISSESEPLEERIRRVEDAVLLLSNRHRGVDVEDVSAAPESSDVAESEAVEAAPPAPALPAPRTKKPARYVPDKIEQAADYQQKRQKSRCNPSDPLCGLE